jgi:uncharacterized membrane protein (UPF0182 family)
MKRNISAKRRTAAIILGIVVAVLILLTASNTFFVDFLWFSKMGYLTVFLKELTTRLIIGVPLFAVLMVMFYYYFRFLKKLSEQYLHVSGRITTRQEKRVAILLTAAVALLIAWTVAGGIWSEALLCINSSGFGSVDALYGQDLSFYFFVLPLLKALYSVILDCFVIMALATFVYTAYVLYRENNYAPRDIPDLFSAVKDFFKTFATLASRQIGVFLAVLFVFLALGRIVALFEMVYGGTGMVYGAGASDIAIGQKLNIVLAVLAIAAGVTAIVAGRRKNFKLMLAGPIAFIGVAVLGAIVQSAYEYVAVVPNQYNQEAPYIQNNIDATRLAYGLDNVEVREYLPNQKITANEIKANDTTISNIPINDMGPTKEMYNSLQGIRNYYKFEGVDVDRYTIDGTYTQVFIGAREMNNSALASDARSWINQHLKYTHGFGLAMSPVNKVNSVGQPELVIKDIPPASDTASLTVDQPRIYIGEGDQSYDVVAAQSAEFDYPKGNDNQENWYDGSAGLSLAGAYRMVFALYAGAPEMALSSQITDASRIIIHRNVMDRIRTIAPFFQYDDNPYLVLVDGKLYWIADAFVKSDRYPYSQPYDKAGDNYIKNSVKVVVDAYNGDVTFYQVADEPITNTYAKIFPGLIKPMDKMPDGIKAHLRYSKTLFDVQAGMYATYHMTNPQVFYNKEDQWQSARQFYGSSKEEVEIESNYIIMKLPGRDTEFMLTKTFTPNNKDNMIAWIAGVSDGDDYGRLLVYQFPKQELIYGPMQIEQRIDQDTVISPQLTLLGQQGSTVLRGNLMTIPIEGGLIYVEPVYLQASGGENNLPEVKKVIVSDGSSIIMGDSLQAALGQLFNYDAGAGNNAAATTGGTATLTVAQLAAQANQLFTEATDAQKAGDWATYGSKLSQLQSVLSQLSQAAGQ